MRKALVFVASFALVLVAGAAVALMGTPAEPAASETAVVDDTTTTSTTVLEKLQPIEEPEHQTKEEPEAHEEKAKARDTEPPGLEISSPEDGARFEVKEIVVEGTTEPGAIVRWGKHKATVDDSGLFRLVLPLKAEGINHFELTAKDIWGNYSTGSVEVHLEAAKEEPKEEPKQEKKKKEEPKNYDFTVTQKYGSCGEEVPYEKFYGKGAPGTEIWAGNQYGSGSTVIGDGGEWHLKVYFPEMPCGPHEIVLETSEGVRKVFEYHHLCEEEGGEEAGDHEEGDGNDDGHEESDGDEGGHEEGGDK